MTDIEKLEKRLDELDVLYDETTNEDELMPILDERSEIISKLAKLGVLVKDDRSVAIRRF